MQIKPWLMGLIVLSGVAACGSTDVERALTGAAAGAVAAEVTENDPLVGALVGASAGALCDDVTPDLCRR